MPYLWSCILNADPAISSCGLIELALRKNERNHGICRNFNEVSMLKFLPWRGVDLALTYGASDLDA